jgi:uncharacterized membrane protein
MLLATAKNVGGAGALLLVLSGLALFANGGLGFLLGFIGIILVIVALKGVADKFNEGRIFNNALYSIIVIIVGVVAFVASLIGSVLFFIANLPDWIRPYVQARDWQGLAAAIQSHAMDPSSFGSFFALIGVVIIAFVVLFVFAVLSMFLLRRSLGIVKTKTGVGLFGTSGLLLLIGAVLTPILIGFLLIWIAWILLTIAFFSVRPAAPSQPAPYQPAPSTVSPPPPFSIPK